MLHDSLVTLFLAHFPIVLPVTILVSASTDMEHDLSFARRFRTVSDSSTQIDKSLPLITPIFLDVVFSLTSSIIIKHQCFHDCISVVAYKLQYINFLTY